MPYAARFNAAMIRTGGSGYFVSLAARDLAIVGAYLCLIHRNGLRYQGTAYWAGGDQGWSWLFFPTAIGILRFPAFGRLVDWEELIPWPGIGP